MSAVLDDWRVRAAVPDDLAAVYQLRVACDLADFGERLLTEEELRARWQVPGFDLARDARVAVDATGRVLGYGEVRRGAEESWLAVRIPPARRGRGIGEALLRAAEARAVEAPGAATLFTQVSDRNDDARHLMERAGYGTDLAFRIMTLTLESAPLPPEWPDGIAVRPFVVGRDERATYEADEEASVDKGYHRPLDFAAWAERMGLGRVDPALWFPARDGDEVAGVALNYVAPATGIGWVDHLGVRRPWRQRGLGMALLRHSFAAFHARGIREVRLSVDERSQTSATRLYERAGMTTLQRYHIYTKHLSIASG
jgi:ribosomal protein S18 acetylase RimI-like enzyme